MFYESLNAYISLPTLLGLLIDCIQLTRYALGYLFAIYPSRSNILPIFGRDHASVDLIRSLPPPNV
jgi:hypothetical protein